MFSSEFTLIHSVGLEKNNLRLTKLEQAVRSTGETNAKYLRTLAVAYAAGGRLSDALRTAERGRTRAGDDPDLAQWFTLKATQYRQAMVPDKN